jgi:beta-glucosidase
MRQSAFAFTSVLVLAAATGAVAACGHTTETLDAYEASKQGSGAGGSSSGSGSGSGATGNVGNTGNFESTICQPVTGPQFDCNAAASQQFDSVSMQSYCVTQEVADAVDDVMESMQPVHFASQMIGVPVGNKNYQDIERSPDVTVPGVGTIRGYNYRDAGRGVNLDAGQHNRPNDKNNYATAFPAPSVRAASWDVELERRVGAAIGDETAASLNNMNLGPCMNIIRHPYWGRTQETYGEDMYHIGRMASAYTVGVQEYVVACAKHFAANNIEKYRSRNNAKMTEQTLREIYGRHFEMVVQDGAVGCIMASYNAVNDVKATQNKHLLRDILKAPVSQNGFGFEGLVITDWWAMPGDQSIPDSSTAQAVTNQAVVAGTDIEVPWTLHYSETTLTQSPDQALVKEAAKRVLTQKFRFKTALDTDGWSLKPPKSSLIGGSIDPNSPGGIENEALAEEAELKSAVLLTNGLAPAAPVLPLKEISTIAVVGPDQEFILVSSSAPKSCGVTDDNPTGQGQMATRRCTFKYATDPALGDRGSSRVNADPTRSVGPHAGIVATAPSGVTVLPPGNTPDAAAGADAIVVAVGYSPGDEGEEYAISTGGDRSSLNLPDGQNEFIKSVLDLNKPTVILIQTGSIVNMPWLEHSNKSQATIWAGYPGQRGALALGKLIFGQANFSGKMPMAWPTQAELDKQPFKDSDEVTQMGYFFGYREYDRRKYIEGQAVDLIFPFGHGMSYSTFEYSNVRHDCPTASKDGIFEVLVDITNTSSVDGDEVAMLFVKPPPKPEGITGERPWKELKSFARVTVPAGQTVTAKLPLRIRDLRRWEGGENGRWVIDSGEYTLLIGKDAEDAENSPNKVALQVNGD